MNRWFEIKYDSSTDYAEYIDEMKQDQFWTQILPITPDTLLLFPRRGKKKKREHDFVALPILSEWMESTAYRKQIILRAYEHHSF